MDAVVKKVLTGVKSYGNNTSKSMKNLGHADFDPIKRKVTWIVPNFKGGRNKVLNCVITLR